MNETNKQLLEAEIQQELEALKEMEIGTDEYKVAIDGLTKLIDRANELKKLEDDSKAKDKERELKVEQLIVERDRLKIDETRLNADMNQRITDNALKADQLREEKSNHIVGYIMQAFGIVASAGLTVWGTIKTIKFEQDGIATTTAGKSFFRDLFRKK